MRIFLRLICFTTALILILSGCAPNSYQPENDRATFNQSTNSEQRHGSNPIVLTESPVQNTRTPSPVPTRTVNQNRVDLTPTETSPTTAASPSGQNNPTQTTRVYQAPVQINNPSTGSRVKSPIQVVSQLNIKGVKLVRIELRGEDGRLLARILKSPSGFPWSSATVSIPLLFEIRAAEEPAILSVSVEDRDGRVIALNSSEILLVKDGVQNLLEPHFGGGPIIILEPGEGEIVSGGTLAVSGSVEPDVVFPLKIELISGDGRLIGQQWIRDIRTEDRSFSAEVRYTTAEVTPARLFVYSKGGRGDQILHLNSIKVTLNP